MMALAASLGWLLSPFVAGALIGRSSRALDLVSRRLGVCLGVGWIGVALLVWGATALGGLGGTLAFIVGGPAAGLAFWGRRGDGPPREPDERGPDEWDWERFERDLQGYSANALPARSSVAATRPRAPALSPAARAVAPGDG
jgi:hypothetical protein